MTAPGYETKVAAISVHHNTVTRTNVTLATQSEAYEKIKHPDRIVEAAVEAPPVLVHGLPRNAFIMLVSEYCLHNINNK